jgi:hypothetical protein
MSARKTPGVRCGHVAAALASSWHTSTDKLNGLVAPSSIRWRNRKFACASGQIEANARLNEGVVALSFDSASEKQSEPNQAHL